MDFALILLTGKRYNMKTQGYFHKWYGCGTLTTYDKGNCKFVSFTSLDEEDVVYFDNMEIASNYFKNNGWEAIAEYRESC